MYLHHSVLSALVSALLHQRVHTEHCHVDGDDDEACHAGQADEDGGFELGDGSRGSGLELGVVVAGNGVHGLFHFAGFLPDVDHIDQNVRKDICLAKAGAERVALFQLSGQLADLLAQLVIIDSPRRNVQRLDHRQA